MLYYGGMQAEEATLTRGSSSPTKIPHKLKARQLYIPKGNVYDRPTEDGNALLFNMTEWIQSVEQLGILETQKYLRICDAERAVMYRMARGERIHGHMKVSMIARLASTPTQKVTREDVLKVLR